MRTIDAVEKDFLKKNPPKFEIGDTVDVHVKIIEGDRERIQIFNGIVIAKRHEGLSSTFTVRRMVQGEGVERIFPLHSPRVVSVDVRRKGKVRRAKLHYLRERVGRATKVEERLGAERGSAAEAPKAEAKPEPKPEPKAEAKAEPKPPAAPAAEPGKKTPRHAKEPAKK